MKHRISCDFEQCKALQTSQVSPPKSQQCGQSATHDGSFSHSPTIYITAMAIRNIQLGISSHITPEGLSFTHDNATNRLEMG